RRRRDELQLRLDAAPEEITADQLSAFGHDINQIIDHGTNTERKRLCELLIDELKINTATTTATPIFRINLNATGAVDTKSARPVNRPERESPARRVFASVDPQWS